MPTSFEALHEQTRPLALLDATPPPCAPRRPTHRTVAALRLVKASLIIGGSAVLLAVA